MDLEFYFLRGLKNKIISPQCHRVKLALEHLLVPYQPIGVSMTDKPSLIAKLEVKDLPVIIDGKWIVEGSWNISNFLERNYVNPPTLMGGEMGKSHLKFIQSWVDGILIPNIFVFILADFHDQLPEGDQLVFRSIEEQRYGNTLENIQADSRENLEIFRQFLHPLRLTLHNQPFFSGDNPAYADYIIYSAFKWASQFSSYKLLDDLDSIQGWLLEIDQILEQGAEKILSRKSS